MSQANPKGVRKFRPENKLASALTDPMGMVGAQAVKRAAENVELVRAEHMAALDAKLDELASLSMLAAASHTQEDAARLYRLAREILADAGIFGLKNICRAAHSLCELMAAGDRHRHQWAGVAVHVEAIAALRRSGVAAGGPGVDAMLAGLEKISRTSL
ncbi:conserved hypothetical protein [uncultured Defluviicoccus sp.]|uniref:Chemotaxis protein CheE n=1 Tax=metagenome TaxID=256318 RepID=A0A380T962_9ZZZZ|nr:conserved hypothetical protein [uncultured Defluviicoccus sp.]